MLTTFSIFESNTVKYSSKTALICDNHRVSYADLGKEEKMLSSSLSKVGIGRGSVVGVQLPNGKLFVETFFSLQRLGAIVVPFGLRLNSAAISDYIGEAGVEYYIYSADFDEPVNQVQAADTGVSIWIRSSSDGDLLEELLETGDPSYAHVEPVCPDDPALYIFTSGTTGQPKVVVTTYIGLLMWLITDDANNSFLPTDVYLSYSPMNHAGGLGRLLRVLCTGATLIMMRKFDIKFFLKIVEIERPSGLLLIPPTYCYGIQDALKDDPVDFSCFKRIETGATIVPPDSIRTMFDLFPNARIYTGYGQNECKSITHLNVSREEYLANQCIIDSCGVASYCCEIRLVDSDYNEVPCGSVGEALVKSPICMKGYLNQSDCFNDGWVVTGDFLRRDENGYYYYVDRKKDIIKSGGEFVSSYEVETVLYNHQGIKDCAVIGIPSKRFAEVVAAVVVRESGSNLTEEDIVSYCRERLPRYKAPRKIFFVDEMPRTPTGKIKKTDLRDYCRASTNSSDL